MSAIVRHTSADLKAMRARGESKTDWQQIHNKIISDVEPVFDVDSPEATESMIAEIDRIKRGRVLGSGTKDSQTVRFDRDILAAFKATGKGWQTRMNNALREWLEQHPMKPV